MMVRVEKDLTFSSGVHFENQFHINTYDLTLSFLLEAESPREHNIALERIEYYIEYIIQSCVFVYREDHTAIEKYSKAGMRVCILPEQPYDQIVAMALLLKLNAITEGRILITDLIICSAMSEGVRYPIVTEIAENADIFLGNHWWNNSSISTCDNQENPDQVDNIVKLFDFDEWAQFGLSWKEKTTLSLD